MRKQAIERVSADAKEKHGMRYTHHLGLARVAHWVRLKFAAINLKKLALSCEYFPCSLSDFFALFGSSLYPDSFSPLKFSNSLTGWNIPRTLCPGDVCLICY